MAMHIAKWGNSLAVRLPATLVRELGLKEGDAVELRASAGATAPVLEVSRVPGRHEHLDALARLGWSLPSGFRFDREAANARGSER